MHMSVNQGKTLYTCHNCRLKDFVREMRTLYAHYHLLFFSFSLNYLWSGNIPVFIPAYLNSLKLLQFSLQKYKDWLPGKNCVASWTRGQTVPKDYAIQEQALPCASWKLGTILSGKPKTHWGWSAGEFPTISTRPSTRPPPISVPFGEKLSYVALMTPLKRIFHQMGRKSAGVGWMALSKSLEIPRL